MADAVWTTFDGEDDDSSEAVALKSAVGELRKIVRHVPSGSPQHRMEMVWTDSHKKLSNYLFFLQVGWISYVGRMIYQCCKEKFLKINFRTHHVGTTASVAFWCHTLSYSLNIDAVDFRIFIDLPREMLCIPGSAVVTVYGGGYTTRIRTVRSLRLEIMIRVRDNR
ncbi:hypothetical protein K435DRAFT_799460 [Dendrothele bispora CBS 962.96]|uniref:Uncharacterized protein n=1 Tax=Dendrothele bispora (strain CBS 962.96) TaxID=1314807 RepID=A0A4S8LVW0_DENBC|nr:hypothetical protein K435DRAFT_799460 [Dendrothele bispora CBS 962.96]